MKKSWILATIALMALFASCSKDSTIETPDNESGASALSFSFAKPQEAFVTRADIASAAEWNIAAMDVYAAIGGTVEKIAATDYKTAQSARTYTITMTQSWVAAHHGATANFYFVGNDATSGGAHTALSATTEADFKNALTNELGITDGKLNLIAKPNYSNNLLFSAVIENVEVMGTISKTAHLKRREARFDIKNSLYANDEFTVDKILVSDASTAGLIFPNGDPSAVTINKLSHVDQIDAPSTYYDYNAENIAPSVFYLYPTELGADKTQIYIIGTFKGGETRTFTVDGTAAGNLIEANKRYTLTLDATSLQFVLTRDDYDEGGNLDVPEGADGDIVLSEFSATGDGLWNEVYLNYEFTATTTNKLSFKVTSKYGTDYTIENVLGNDAATAMTVDKTTAITYADIETIDTYSVNVPADAGTQLLFTLTVKAKQSDYKKVFSFSKRAGGEADLIYIDGTKLALGKWGAEITSTDQIAYFKFGSVVGITRPASKYNYTYVKFDPTGLRSTGAYDNYSGVPVYNSGDYAAGIKSISDPAYHNAVNVALGKGDPCKLVGFTIGADDPATFDSGWHTPTFKENGYFVGGKAYVSSNYNYSQNTSTANDNYCNFWQANAGNSSKTNPSAAILPIIQGTSFNPMGMTLPAVGVLSSIGANQGAPSLTKSVYWSAESPSQSSARVLAFSSSSLDGTSNRFEDGLPVRCVKNL